MQKTFCAVLGIGNALLATIACAGGLTPDDLVVLNRISDPQISPDASQVAFVVSEPDLSGDRRTTDIWIISVDGMRDSTAHRVTVGKGNDHSPQWSTTSESLYFLSDRSGSSQVWRVEAESGMATQITDYGLDLSNLLLSPDGKWISFTARVFPDCEAIQCTVERLQQQFKSRAMVFEKLPSRHWDAWQDRRSSALFTVAIRDGERVQEEPTKLFGGLLGNVPAYPFGDRNQITFAPDSRTLFFTVQHPASGGWMDQDIFQVPVDGSAKPSNLSAENDAIDTRPVVSPDGQYITWSAMSRPMYESDQLDIIMQDPAGGEVRNLTREWDRSVEEVQFDRGGRSVYVVASDAGTKSIFKIDITSGTATSMTAGFSDSEIRVSDQLLVFIRSSFGYPGELYALRLTGHEKRASPAKLTSLNSAVLDDVSMSRYDKFKFIGAENDGVFGHVFRPVEYVKGKKYPVALLVHGGPQGSFGEGWSYRWNPQVFAAMGFAVVTIDFHGSIGYGQAFVDSIHGDWGGKPLLDLELGLKGAAQMYSWIDADNVCVLGASYGGYLVNWIAGKRPERYKCLVSHDGIFDLRSFYYSTDELWFPEWEFDGPQFESETSYESWNPVNHVSKWRTPMLVLHGANDYRVPIEQSISMFTALQRQSIPSKLVVFPDENHWVLSPAGSLQWHAVVGAWLKQYLTEEKKPSR